MQCIVPSKKLLLIMETNKLKEAEFEFHFVTGTVLILLEIRLMRWFYNLADRLLSVLMCRISSAVSRRKLILREEESRGIFNAKSQNEKSRFSNESVNKNTSTCDFITQKRIIFRVKTKKLSSNENILLEKKLASLVWCSSNWFNALLRNTLQKEMSTPIKAAPV